MKKMLLATTSALLITGCAQQTFAVETTGSSSTKGNHHPIISSFLELGEENCPVRPKFVAQKMLLKQKPGKHS